MGKEGRSMTDDRGSLLGVAGWAFVIGGLVGGGSSAVAGAAVG